MDKIIQKVPLNRSQKLFLDKAGSLNPDFATHSCIQDPEPVSSSELISSLIKRALTLRYTIVPKPKTRDNAPENDQESAS